MYDLTTSVHSYMYKGRNVKISFSNFKLKFWIQISEIPTA